MQIKTKIVPLLFLISGICSVWAQNPVEMELKQVYTTQIYFDFGKSELRNDDLPILGTIDSLLKENPNRELRISAHTDAIGQEEANQKLSLDRANSVINFLKNKGIGQEKINYEYHGEKAPQADNDSDQGRQQNRRAQLEIFEKTEKKAAIIAASVPPVNESKEKQLDPKPIKPALVELKGQVKDSTGRGLKAKVILKSKSYQDSVTTKEDGFYSFKLPDSTVVALDVYADGYFFDTKMFRVLKGKTTHVRSVLKRAECGETFPLKRMYFYGNQAVLLPSSKPELKRLLYFMHLNADLILEIGGHINRPFVKPSKLSYIDRQLSVNRAKMVHDYLISQGISEKRLSYEGYGNKFMIFPKARREKEMSQNRRVELKVFCKKDKKK